MLDVDVDLRRLDAEVHLGDPPGSSQAEDVLVEFGVEYGAGLEGVEAFSLTGSPTKNSDGPPVTNSGTR
jgi:hypothetical protein